MRPQARDALSGGPAVIERFHSVIASEAKQSILQAEAWIATSLALLAMTMWSVDRDKSIRRANHQFRFTETLSSPEIKNISLFQK
jgi:hypothetical protein